MTRHARRSLKVLLRFVLTTCFWKDTSRFWSRKRPLMKNLTTAILLTGLFWTCPTPELRAQGSSGKIVAQQLLENALKSHPEVSGLELSATPPGKKGCVTIASTDPKDINEKCDKDESLPIETGKPFVEKEKDGYDVTVRLEDLTGKVVGALGMDFKPKPGQEKAEVVKMAEEIARQIKEQIPNKAGLFESVK